MIVYFDASALVKRYIAETGSTEVEALVGGAQAVATVVVSRVEVAAALGKAVRMKVLERDAGAAALAAFQADWHDFVRIQISEALAARAAGLAWEQGLRGYDAVHLASALCWHDILGEGVTLATYDRDLWESAQATGLTPWPGAMP